MFYGTLGARDFSYAVSGFGQAFISAPPLAFRPSAEKSDPTAREKNLWYPG